MRFTRLDVWCRLRYGLGVAGALVLSVPCVAADVDSVLVRQQWPWSTDVKVEYRLSNVTAPVNIKVECFNNGVAMPSEDIDSAIVGRTYGLTKADEGVGFFYIDPVKAFGKTQVSLANFTVKLSLSDTDAIDTEPIYKIIDLQTKTVQHLSRADFYNDRGQKYGGWETNFAAIGSSPSSGTPYTTSLKNVFIWTGVTNNIEYKTTKLVMRRIPAKNQTFTMGGANDWKSNNSDKYSLSVQLTNDYWLAVFETTYKQSRILQGYSASDLTDAESVVAAIKFTKADGTALTSYNQMRGLPSEWTDWPQDVYAVSSSCALHRMRNQFPGLRFDLPTEAQWEFACRAGTDTMYYSGVNPSKSEDAYVSELAPLAWFSGNASARKEVGLLKPNAFGLYDMLGNVGELTRDLHNPDTMFGDIGPAHPTASVEPMGWNDLDAVLAKNEKCIELFRGESYGRNYERVKCASRRSDSGYILTSAGWANRFGARMWLPYEQ